VSEPRGGILRGAVGAAWGFAGGDRLGGSRSFACGVDDDGAQAMLVAGAAGYLRWFPFCTTLWCNLFWFC